MKRNSSKLIFQGKMELVLLCTKIFHFEFNDEAFQQLDDVAMESPLGPVTAGIFMVELENTLNPRLKI